MEPHNNKILLNLEKIRSKILSDFLGGKLHHSVLFVGSRGLGKATLCYHIANKILDFDSELQKKESISLFGDAESGGDDLSDDNPTFNLIKNKKHPDLLVIEKDYDSKTSKTDKEIKVTAARKIMDFISLSPFLSKNKVVIIDSIDEMNVSAQNAILKILEEPLKNTYILLVCHNSNNILDTKKSRCREVDVQNYNITEWKYILEYAYNAEYKKLNNEQLNNLYNITSGSISLTKNIIEEDGLSLYDYIEKILSNDFVDIEAIHSFADKLNDNDKLFSLFNNFIVLFLYRVLVYFSAGKVSDDFKNRNSNFILKNNESSIMQKIKFTQEVLDDISRYNLSKKHGIVVLLTMLQK